MQARRSIVLTLLVAAAVAAFGYAFWQDVRELGLLSDDWLLPALLRDAATTTDVDWPFVLRDFVGPWFGTEGTALYRPLVSVSLGIDLERGGLEDPRILHGTNLALHAGSSFLTAVLAALLAPRWKPLCALVAGLFFATHPLTSEAASWIVARNSGLVVFFMLASSVAFVLASGQRRVFGYCALFFAVLALLTKETAVLLPLFFLLVDVIRMAGGSSSQTSPSFTAFCWRHARWSLVFVAYFLWRIVLFGSVLGDGLSARPTLTSWLHGLGTRLSYLAVPRAQMGLDGAAFAYAGLAVLVLACLLALRYELRRTALLVVAVAASLVASTFVAADVAIDSSSGTGTRVLLVLVPQAALLTSVLVGRVGRPAGWLALAPLPMLLVAAYTAREMQGRLHHAGASMRSFMTQVRAATEAGDLAAMVASPSQAFGVPFINPNAVFPIVTAPMVDHTARLVGLNCVLLRLPDQPELFHDAHALRAVLASGGKLLLWADERLHALTRSAAPPPSVSEVHREDTRLRFDLAQPCSPFDFEEVVVEGCSDADAQLQVVGPQGTLAQTFTASVVDAALHFPIGKSIDVAALAFSGAVQGFELSGCSATVPTLRLLRDAPRIDLGGSDFDRDDIVIEIRDDGRVFIGSRPAAGPATAGLRLVVLTSGVGYITAEHEGPVRFDPHVLQGLQRFARSDRGRRLWLYWERDATPTARYARSRLVEVQYRLEGDV